MTNNKQGLVQIPIQTLNALKNMLFSNEGGVDFSNLINDLTPTEEHRDLTAIHIALVHKGVQIDICKAARYVHDWHNRVTKYEYISYSLILGIIRAKAYTCHIDENGDLVVDNERDGFQGFCFDQWATMTTDAADLLSKIKR